MAFAKEQTDKEVDLAKLTAESEQAERGRRDATQYAAEGDIAATKENNTAQLNFLKQQAAFHSFANALQLPLLSQGL